MRVEEMARMKNNGATYKEIADFYGLSKQRVYQLLHSVSTTNNPRGKHLEIQNIKYKGAYEYFRTHPHKSISSFSKAVFGYTDKSTTEKLRRLFYKTRTVHLSVEQFKKICEIIGKPFEEVFSE